MVTPKTTQRGGKPPNNNVIDPILDVLQKYKQQRAEPTAFLRERGLNTGYTRWLDRCLEDGPRWSDTIAGPGWQSITVAFPAQDAPLPAYIVLPRAPRQCDVSGEWFVPTNSRQRFAPGLSEAARRAARRDVYAAREKFAELGDWGKTNAKGGRNK